MTPLPTGREGERTGRFQRRPGTGPCGVQFVQSRDLPSSGKARGSHVPPVLGRGQLLPRPLTTETSRGARRRTLSPGTHVRVGSRLRVPGDQTLRTSRAVPDQTSIRVARQPDREERGAADDTVSRGRLDLEDALPLLAGPAASCDRSEVGKAGQGHTTLLRARCRTWRSPLHRVRSGSSLEPSCSTT